MKQLLTVFLFFSLSYTFADTPGKRKMFDSKISFQNIVKFSNYTFYWSAAGVQQNNVILISDTSQYMSATGGAPMDYFLWAVNNQTKKSTDTVSFHNYYSPDYVVIINEIKEDSILYNRLELSNKNTIVSETNTNEINDKTLIADAKKAKQNHYLKIGGFITLGLAALGGIVWFFKRKKKETV